MKLMVASHRGTVSLASKLLVLGLCLGFSTSQLRAQDEGTSTPAEPATETTPAPEPAAEPTPQSDVTSPAETKPAETKPAETKPAEEGLGEKIKDKIEDLKKSRVQNRKETTDAIVKRRGKDPETAKYVLAGEGQTLPEKVARFRYVRRNVVGNQTYEDGGNKKDIGIDAVVNVNAYVLEYGLTDKFSFQVLIPQISSNQVTINNDKFVESKIYKKKYKEMMDKVVPTLQAQGECSTTDSQACYDMIDAGYKLKTNTKLTLPTGEVYEAKKENQIRNLAKSLITNAAKPSDGETGLSDVMVAGLYNVYSSKSQLFSVGGGLRLPTSKADDEKSWNRTGSGFTTVGVALKYDYKVSDPFIVSLSNQTEIHVKNPHYKRHSLINSAELNEADPNATGTTDAPGDGDGVSNNFEVSRKVPLNNGFVRLGYALGALSPILNVFTTYLYYNWNFDPETYYDGHAQANGSKYTSVNYAVAFDGLGLQPRIPVAVSVAQERMLSGENVSVAAVNTYLSLITYYKF